MFQNGDDAGNSFLRIGFIAISNPATKTLQPKEAWLLLQLSGNLDIIYMVLF